MGRQKVKDIRRKELIEASMNSIYRHGFAEVTVSQIAQDAQTSTGSIHYYFGGKDALLEATMRHLLARLRNANIRMLAGNTDPEDRLRAIVFANFDQSVMTAQSCRVWTQFWAYAPYHTGLARLQALNISRVRSHLRRELRQLIAPQFVDAIVFAIQTYMDGVWVQAAQSDTEPDLRVIHARTDEFLSNTIKRSGSR